METSTVAATTVAALHYLVINSGFLSGTSTYGLVTSCHSLRVNGANLVLRLLYRTGDVADGTGCG